MPLAAGVRLGAYETLNLVGEGGMGQVYRARDTRLDRVVALKVLPEPFAADPDRRERFEREARAVAALNHPHICQLHDVGEAAPGGEGAPIRFLVMEYLEGQTLEERLLRGALPMADVLRVAIDLADALDHAHRRGLVHRDLKPGNVMLTRTGAKLLDFGLSRLQPPTDLTAMTTVIEGRAPLTAEGAVLGTYPYMAPEQLSGREADARTDIFAFGAVLYEMITGARAFAGTTAATVIGAILHTDPPPVSARQALAPAQLDRVVARCLAKDPDNRWQTMRDVVLELQWMADHPAGSATTAATSATKSNRRWSIAFASLAAAAALSAVAYLGGAPAAAPAIELMFAPPNGVTLADPRLSGPVTISPDGHLFAFVAIDGDGRQQRLWVRPIDNAANARALAGTEGASFPFWSPDSRQIGFFAQRKLKRIAALGGSPQTLSDAVQPRGGAWGTDGTILFSAQLGFELSRVPAAGGVASAVPADGRNQERLWPAFLSDGRHYLYFGRPQKHGIYLAELDSTMSTELMADYVGSVSVAQDYLLVLRGSSKSARSLTLQAQRVAPGTFLPTGEAAPVGASVTYASGLGRGAFAASRTGTLVYTTIERAISQFTWFDRGGNQMGHLDGSISYFAPSFSRDGTRLAAARVDPEVGTPDLWSIDVTRGIAQRLTYDPREDFFPVWSPDRATLVFGAQSPGTPPNVFHKALGVPGNGESLVRSRYNDQPTDWSPDGQFVIYSRRDPRSQWDLWLKPMSPEGSRTETPFLSTAANEHLAQFSPDGRWVAYVSDESGTNEVYVESFPKRGTREQMSNGGGSQPRWKADGRELFYLSADGHLMSVAVNPGTRLEPGKPSILFKSRIFDVFGAENNGYNWNYAVAPDGNRFLITTVTDESATIPTTTVVLNWLARLRRP